VPTNSGKIATAVVAALVIILAGCAKHDGLPTPLSVGIPPTVTNLVVTNPQGLDYDITWDIADPSVVRHYRVYAIVPGFNGDSAQLADTTTTTTFLATLAIAVPGVRFGVSVVTLENVEGAMVVAAPQ